MVFFVPALVRKRGDEAVKLWGGVRGKDRIFDEM